MGRERTAVAAPSPAPAPAQAAVPARAPDPGVHRAVVSRARATGPTPSSHLQRAMRVSAVNDPHEREAETIAARISAGGPLRALASPGSVSPSRQRDEDAAARAVLRLTGTSTTASRAASGAEAAGATARAGAQAPVGPTGGEVPAVAHEYLANPGAGAPLDASLGAQLGLALGADLSAVRVHTDARAQEAAAALGARAFTVGRDISLAAGESPLDLHLMAHEATHVVQQQAAPLQTVPSAAPTGAPPALSRLAPAAGAATSTGAAESDSLIPDFILDSIKSFARNFPGYTLMTVIAGYDPIAGEAVARTPDNLVAGVIGLVPFGNEIVARLRESDLVQRIFTVIESGLAQHNLTRERFSREISTAWDELTLANGIDGNLAVIERHIRAVTTDVLAFAMQMVDAVMAAIREAAIGLAEAAVQRPGIAPTWSLATKVFHRDPLRGVDVQATTVEILADLLRLARRDEVLEQLQANGRLQKAADWIDSQLAQFGTIYTEAVALFSDAWAALSPANVGRLVDIITGLAEQAVRLFVRVVAWVDRLLEKALELVKEALLGRLSAYAHRSQGFPLLTVVLGADPFTGDAVPRTAENLVHGFIALLPGGEETYARLQESGAIAQAGAKIEGELTRLGITGDFIGKLFSGVWNAFTLQDLLSPFAAFERVVAALEEPLQRLFSFISTVVMAVVEVILAIMNFPVEVLGSIMGNVATAFDKIVQDPVGFIINLLAALKSGVSGFLGNAAQYVKDGLVSWLGRGLGTVGITMPADFTLGSVLGLVFDVVGVTAEALWGKLGKHVGEPVAAKLRSGAEMAGEAWAWVTALMNEGLGALWRFLGDKLEGLWTTILDSIEGWVVTEIIEAAGAKLLSMLDPTGVMAVVNSFLAFFRAVQSAVEYLREILGIVNEYTSTLAAVAMGNLAAGAAKLESALAHAVPVAIGFLATQVGLANVPEKVIELIGATRALIDEALDWLIGQAVRVGGPALRALGFGGEAEASGAATAGATGAGAMGAAAPAGPESAADQARDDEGPVDEHFTTPDRADHHLYLGAGGTLMVASENPQPVAVLSQLNALYAEWAALPAAAPSRTRKRIARRMIALIKTDPRLLSAISGDDVQTPRRPAPGIGLVGAHGAKVSSLQSGAYPVVWEMTSEHVIPRGYASALFTGLELDPVSEEEYAGLTTIMIYRGAADVKNEKAETGSGSDFTLIKPFLRNAGGDPNRGPGKAPSRIRDSEENVRKAYRLLARGAITRTVRAVVTENAAVNPALAGGLTNGQRRGPDGSPEPVTPQESAIREAAELEGDQIIELLDERLQALESSS